MKALSFPTQYTTNYRALKTKNTSVTENSIILASDTSDNDAILQEITSYSPREAEPTIHASLMKVYEDEKQRRKTSKMEAKHGLINKKTWCV